MRRLQRPTLHQWGCEHRWKTTTSRPAQGGIVRVRYLTCWRCGLKVKTEERLAVPWDTRDLKALVEQAFPEDTIINVAITKAQGLLGDGLSQLNAYLLPHGWQLDIVRNRGRVVGVVRRRMSTDALDDISAGLDKGKSRHHGTGDQ